MDPSPQETTTSGVEPDATGISASRRVLTFFGIGRDASRARKSLVSVLCNLAWGFAQFFVIFIVLLLPLKSPRNPNVSEWDACDRPLGVWAALWLIRVVLASSLSYWEYRRVRQLHFTNRSDTEGMPPTSNQTQASQGQQQSAPLSLNLYSMVTFLSFVLTLVWFVTGNILVYTSINTCRYAAPRLRWLNLAVLCKMYLMVLKFVVHCFVFLMVVPILYIFSNIFLISIGRHPMQNPNVVRPEIGKLPKHIVDRIPLVAYIPSPPSDDLSEEKSTTSHVYPPKKRMKFKRLQRFASRDSKPSKARTQELNKNTAHSWTDDWEQGQYPFIILSGNRAACAICLNDFEAPPRRKASDITEETTSREDQGHEKTSISVSVSMPKESMIKTSTIKVHRQSV